MSWISVKDRLPAIGKLVIVWDSFYEEVRYNMTLEVNYMGLSFVNDECMSCGIDDITHWRPLLEPPEKEK